MGVRPVDAAMDDERAEKATIRRLWIEKVNYHHGRVEQDDDRVYLSLVGHEGRDLVALVESGIIELTETNSLTPESARRIVAVERNKTAVLGLQRRFPGLKIYEQSIENLLRGESLIRFPEGIDMDMCRAAVVNLDLNEPLGAEVRSDDVHFPLVRLIEKFALMHSQAPRRDWTLLLTVHGELNWDRGAWEYVTLYLQENFERVREFADAARSVMGEDCYDAIANGNHAELAGDKSVHQRILLVLLPKLVADAVRRQNWRIGIAWSYQYGLPDTDRAPMVAWAVDFTTNERRLTADALYKANLRETLLTAGRIDSRGRIFENDA